MLTFGTPAIALVDQLRAVFHQIACSLLINPAGQVEPPVGSGPPGRAEARLMRPGSPGLVPIAPQDHSPCSSRPARPLERVRPCRLARRLVGRETPLLLDDEEVSRHHITVTVDRGGTVTVADPGSRNGTVVSGLRLDG